MKTLVNLFFILLLNIFSLTSQSQNHILTPNDADIIVSMRGENLFDKVSLEEMKSTPIMNEMFKGLTQMLGEEDSDVSQLGINLNSEAQYFLKFQEDGNILMGTSFEVDDPEKFTKVFLSSSEIQKEDGIQFSITEGYTKCLKGNKGLVTYSVITPKYEDNSYYDPYYEYNDAEIEEYIYEDEIIGLDDEMVEMPPMEIPEEDIQELEEEVEESREEFYEEEETIDVIEDQINEQDFYTKYEEEQKKKNEELGLVSSSYAKQLMMANNPQLDLSLKRVDNNADFSILMNSYNGFFKFLMMNQYNSPYGYQDPFETEMNKMAENLYADFEWISLNGYYDDDELRIETNSKFKGELATWYEKMLDADFNDKMLNYIPFDDHIGFISGSYNTQAVLDGYYDYTRSISNSMSQIDGMDVGQNVSIIMDLIEMFVDEAAIANMYKGDFYAGITDINSYEVEYTTYEYDADWNYKEITKTKEEVRPDFLVMFSSDDPKNINNIFKLLEINSRGMFQKKENYYMMPSGRDIPLDVYAMQKDGIVFIFSSQRLFDFINNGGEKPSSENKNLVKNNSSIMQLSGGKLAEKIPLTDMPSDLQSVISFMRENAGDLSLKHDKMQENILSADLTLSVKGKHKNSLAYFIHMVNEISSIGKNNSTYRN